jgi:membrane peptidoglycan carboxypeptidase
VETAARSYFNKPAADLNLAEAAMMAGIIQAPEEYSPFSNYKLAKQRQATVLDRMVRLKWITPEEAQKSSRTTLIGWKNYFVPRQQTALRHRSGDSRVKSAIWSGGGTQRWDARANHY